MDETSVYIDKPSNYTYAKKVKKKLFHKAFKLFDLFLPLFRVLDEYQLIQVVTSVLVVLIVQNVMKGIP